MSVITRPETYYDIDDLPCKVGSQAVLPRMPLLLTAPMKRRLTRRTRAMIDRSLRCFPELDGATITVGYTRKHLGSATVIYRDGTIAGLIIRLRARRVSYQTIGHELTHLVQGLAHGDRARRAGDSCRHSKVPSGEQQCDIWTLARDPLFCDDAPTYIKLPRRIRENWMEYAERVRRLCIDAIDKRRTNRLYIRWLENELERLGRSPREESPPRAQLLLPL
jgi:hypothetical protein